MNIYLDLFLTCAKVGVCTFGGGYAMLPILQREVVEKKGWATDEEITDYFAVGQCTPGIIAVNTATFVGRGQAGIAGGAVATLGLVFPSLVIIMVIAAFLQNFMHLEFVVHAFNGVRAGVVALIASSVIKLFKNAVIDWPTRIIYAVVLVMAWGMVFLTNTQGGIGDISRKSWLFLILSGLATGASWLCYYKALQIGEASKVVPVDKLSVVITLALAFVFLHEKFTAKSLAGCVLIGLGTLLMVL